MKKKGSESDILNDRDRNILEMFLKLKKTCSYGSMYAICKAISVMPADRYYISEAMAAIIWSKWRRTGKLPIAGKCKRKLYMSFIQECERISVSKNSNRAIIREALEYKAPCIGVCPDRIFMILKKHGQR